MIRAGPLWGTRAAASIVSMVSWSVFLHASSTVRSAPWTSIAPSASSIWRWVPKRASPRRSNRHLAASSPEGPRILPGPKPRCQASTSAGSLPGQVLMPAADPEAGASPSRGSDRGVSGTGSEGFVPAPASGTWGSAARPAVSRKQQSTPQRSLQ